MPKDECLMSLAEVISLQGRHRGCIHCCFSSGPADPAYSAQVGDLIRGFKKCLLISSVLKQMEEETKPAGIRGKFCLMSTVTVHLHSTHTFLLQMILKNVERIQSNSKTPFQLFHFPKEIKMKEEPVFLPDCNILPCPLKTFCPPKKE